MLERIDNKYIIRSDRLKLALESLSDKFDVLEIDERRSFGYATRYFDDALRRGYYDHHQRRRKRCKARIRHYLDADFSFLEVKVNDQRSQTTKRRLQVDAPLTELDEPCMEFIRGCYRNSYGDEFQRQLQPVILIKYHRTTLVAKEGGERLTIDTALEFRSDQCSRHVRPDMCIIETKSARGNGIADKVLRALHVQPTRRVSKYCLGMAVTGQVARWNGFLPALRKLELFQSDTTALPSAQRTPQLVPPAAARQLDQPARADNASALWGIGQRIAT